MGKIKVPLFTLRPIGKTVCLAISMQLIVICSSAQLSVQKLLTENNHNPIGLDVTIPRFSWQLLSSKRNVFQTAYQIQVFIAGMDNAVVWNSGKVMSEQSVLVPYSGAVN